jgi:hypothetical protein
MLGAIERPKIKVAFKIPDRYEIVLVVALGTPAEEVVLEDAASGDAVTYYRDPQDVHHVPKRPMSDIVMEW